MKRAHWVSEIAWCNAYATWSDSTAFGRHHDDHDVVIVQAEGSKDWVVYGPDGCEERAFEGTLLPGDVLHIPRGWDHEVTGRGEPSLHWTFGFRRQTTSDLLTALVTDAGARTATATAYWQHEGGLSDQSAAELAQLLDEVRERSGALDAASRRANAKDRRSGVSLPWSVSPTSWDRAAVRWAARLPPVVERVGESLSVATLGRRYQIDGRLGAALEALGTGERIPVTELARLTSFGLAGLVVFLDFAMREQIVIVERMPGQGADHDEL